MGGESSGPRLLTPGPSHLAKDPDSLKELHLYRLQDGFTPTDYFPVCSVFHLGDIAELLACEAHGAAVVDGVYVVISHTSPGEVTGDELRLLCHSLCRMAAIGAPNLICFKASPKRLSNT